STAVARVRGFEPSSGSARGTRRDTAADLEQTKRHRLTFAESARGCAAAIAIWGAGNACGTITMSTRRFICCPRVEEFSATGWNSPYPAADKRSGANPSPSISSLTSVVARAVDSSQLEAKDGVWMGTLSVWPSMRSEQLRASRKLATRWT